MDIHFCDLCNESVPQSDLENGLAFLRKGRVVCARCEQAMGGEGERPAGVTAAQATAGPPAAQGSAGAQRGPAAAHAQPASGGGVATALGALAILVTAAVAVLVFDRIERGELELDRDVGSLRREVSDGLALVRGDLAEARRAESAAIAALTSELADLRGRHEERGETTREATQALGAELSRIADRLAGLEATASDVTRHEQDIGALVDEYSKLRQDVALVADRLADLEDGVASAPAAEPEAEAGGASGPEWSRFVDALSSPSPGDRWEAVQRLGETGDPDVVPYLLPLLHDPDTFVRMASARVLGDLEALEAVGALIDALEDSEPTVRETAYLSLRAITDPLRRDPLPFDPDAGEADRTRKVKAWRDWWKKESERVLGGRGQT